MSTRITVGTKRGRKVRPPILCVTLCLALLLSLCQTGVVSANVDRSFGEPVDLGSMMHSIAIYNASFGKEDGRDVMYTTASGDPAIFQVIDLHSREVLRTFPLIGAESSWSHLTLPDGSVYIGGSGGSGRLYSYSPATKSVRDVGHIGEGVAYGLSHDELGRVYFGSYPNGKVGRYDPATGEMRDYGSMAPGHNYSRGTAYLNGYLYVGLGIQGAIAKLNVETGDRVKIELPDYEGFEPTEVYQLNAAGKYVVAGLDKGALLFYDTEAEKWEETYYLNNKGIQLSQGKPGSNKVYFAQNGRLMEVDLETLDAVDTGVEFNTFLRNTAWIDVPDDPELPGSSLATVMFGGAVAYMNLDTKVTKTIQYPISGNPIPIQALEKGPGGKLYMSGYPGGQGAIYSPETDHRETLPLGQVEGMEALGDKMYMGVYTGAHILELDTTKPTEAGVNPRQLFHIPGQDRPFKMEAAYGKLFIATIPDYGKLGGSLTVYDPATEEHIEYSNVVHNQSIVGLAAHDGKLFGSTTVAGGLGIDPSETAAKLFVWDIGTGKKLQEWIPSIPGLAAQPKMISGLSFGPDGLLWAAADGAIFAVDPDTLAIVKSRVIYSGIANYGRWRPVHIRWGADGKMYTTLAGRITVIDPATLSFTRLANTELMTLGDDGHIYYADGTQLKKVEVSEGTSQVPVELELPMLNGSFDDDPVGDDGEIAGWSSLFELSPNVSYELSTEETMSSPYSLKLTDKATTETVAVASDPIRVIPGTEYIAAVNVFLKEGRTLASLNFYDDSGKQLGNKSAEIMAGAGQWQQHEMKMEAPAGASYARIVLFCSNFWMTTAYYDNVSLKYMGTELSVISTNPFDGDQNIPLDKTIEVAYNRPIEKGSAFDDIKLMKGLTEIPANVTIDGANIRIAPETDLALSTQYTVVIPAKAVKDEVGYEMAKATSLSFRTVEPAPEPDPEWIVIPLPNGSFDAPPGEDGGIAGWSPMFELSPNVSYSLSSERAVSPPYSLKLVDHATDETVALISDPVKVVPETEYEAAVSVYLQEGRTLASLNFYDDSGKQLGNKSVEITAGAGQWQQHKMRMTAPAGASYAQIVLFCSNFWMTTAYYDNVTLQYIAGVQPEPDTEKPQWPDGSVLTVTDVKQTSVHLSWPAAEDNEAVAHYRILVNGNALNVESVTDNVYTVTDLTAGTTYTFTVIAIDAAGNESLGLSASATTLPRQSGGDGPIVYIPSANADLKQLHVKAGETTVVLSPEFAPGTTSYTGKTEADQVTVTATASHPAAQVKIGGKAIGDGQDVALTEGDNTITLTVTAESGATKAYTIMISKSGTGGEAGEPEPDKPEPAEPTEPSVVLTDIAGHWAQSYIERAVAKGFVKGYPDGEFRPDRSVSRAEFTVMMAAALGLQPDTNGKTLLFTDQEQVGEWAQQALTAAVQAGIIGGYEDGSFRPAAAISRAEMAVMIERALQLKEEDGDHAPGRTEAVKHTASSGGKGRFVDEAEIPAWAKEAAANAVDGRGHHRFAPNESATRAEAVTMLLRLLDVQSGESL